MQSQLKILYVDDHEGLRNCMGNFITSRNPQVEFCFAKNDDDAKKILKENPEVKTAIIDINLNGKNGLSFIGDFRKINPELNILVYTMFSDLLHIEQAIRKNVQGYITKDSNAEEFEKALISVAGGSFYFNKNARAVIKSILAKNDNATHQKNEEENLFENYKTLTKGEKKIFELVANQKNTEEIANSLGKSAKTVRNQISLINQKMFFSDRTELVNAAKILGVIL